MLKIRFTDPAEFVEELGQNDGSVTDRILRVTTRHRPAPDGPGFSVYVLAGFLTGDTLVYLDRRLGHFDSPAHYDAEGLPQTKAVLEMLQGAAKALNLAVRPGVFEPDC